MCVCVDINQRLPTVFGVLTDHDVYKCTSLKVYENPDQTEGWVVEGGGFGTDRTTRSKYGPAQRETEEGWEGKVSVLCKGHLDLQIVQLSSLRRRTSFTHRKG